MSIAAVAIVNRIPTASLGRFVDELAKNMDGLRIVLFAFSMVGGVGWMVFNMNEKDY